ncbi:hypothetical protein G9P44_006191 [Scheffersomyces stipitis]|nr:hypothetical protein G9P44_006191 [Scheffersomyces stipitis]
MSERKDNRDWGHKTSAGSTDGRMLEVMVVDRAGTWQCTSLRLAKNSVGAIVRCQVQPILFC